MGFFSWTCAKTNLPIMAGEAWGSHPEWCDVVLLTDGGRRVAVGSYDGYGNLFMKMSSNAKGRDLGYEINFVDTGLTDELDSGRAKLVLERFYDPKTDTFESLGRSHSEPGQGYFHNEDFVERCFEAGGFRSFVGYRLAYNNVVPFEVALTLDEAQAKVFSKAGDRLAKAVLEERVNRMRGAFDIPVTPQEYSAPSQMTLVPVEGNPNQFAVLVKPDDQGNQEFGRELARLTLDGNGEGSFAETAKAIVDACDVVRLRKIVCVRDFETVAEITVYATEILDHWYEVEANGRTYAFWGAHDALDHFGLEKYNGILDKMCSFDPSDEVMTFEQPSQMPTPSGTMH